MPNVLINDARTGYTVGSTQLVTDATALAWIANRWALLADAVALDPLSAQEQQTLQNAGVGAVSGAGNFPVPRFSPAWAVLTGLRSTIISNGSTVAESDLLALRDPLDKLIRSSVWGKLLELWVPVGNGVLGALCKIKGSTTKVMTGNGLVDADYTRWLGVTGNGSSKDIATGFTPTGITASWGAAVLQTATPGSGLFMGDGSSMYLGFANGDAKIAGAGGSNTLPLATSSRMVAVQNGATASAWWGGYQVSSLAAGASSGGAMRLLSYAGSLYSNGSLGGFAAWAPVLTAVEMKLLADFFDTSAYLLGRSGVGINIIGAGDSQTSGVGLGLPTTQCFLGLLAADFSATQINQGLVGWSMSSATQNGGSSGVWSLSHPADLTRAVGSLLTVMLGTNDDRFGASLSQFAIDYEAWLNVQFQMGWKPGDVLLMSTPASTDALSSTSRQVQIQGIVAGLAAKYGCLYTDVYALTLGTTFQGDNLHMTAAQHLIVKNGILATLAASSYSGAQRS